ncbi:tRNA dihydrouridine synthase DusB [bacterium]|nr:tRNA dihydrouridine synthase DusB [candidate division CSSED10-310 bacterium]
MISPKTGTFSFSVAAAPLAGVTDPPFQRILFEQNCPLVYTEMISARNLLKSPRTITRVLNVEKPVHPLAAQLFDIDPCRLADAAGILERYGVDIIDVNLGCPVKKIINTGCGVALMRNPGQTRCIMKAVRGSVRIPVSVKLRLGWNPGCKSAPDFARMAEDEGLDFVTVHARYRTNYLTPADWREIREVKTCLSIPVMGNGDVMTADDARKMMHETDCDAVMIGRAIMGRPWLPFQIESHLSSGRIFQPVMFPERCRVIRNHLDLAESFYGPRVAPLVFRKHAAWYLRGLPGANQLRNAIFRFTDTEEYRSLLDSLIVNTGALC